MTSKKALFSYEICNSRKYNTLIKVIQQLLLCISVEETVKISYTNITYEYFWLMLLVRLLSSREKNINAQNKALFKKNLLVSYFTNVKKYLHMF